jgi:hypothetical protein
MRHVELINPRHDVDFVMLVDRLAADADRPEDLERQLRQTYPNAVVRSRGLAAEPVDVWYVYRDGAWTPTADGDATPPG